MHYNNIEYEFNGHIDAKHYVALVSRTAEHGIDLTQALDLIQQRLKHSNLIVSAWYEGDLVGISRSITDFHDVCYQLELIVASGFRHSALGQTLKALTKSRLTSTCHFIDRVNPTSHQGLSGWDIHPN